MAGVWFTGRSLKKKRVPAHDQSHDLDDSRDRPGHPPAGLSRNSWGSLFSLLPRNVSNHVKPSQNSFKTFSDAQYLRRRTKVIMWGKDLSCSMLRLVFRVWQLKLVLHSTGPMDTLKKFMESSRNGPIQPSEPFMHISPRTFCT